MDILSIDKRVKNGKKVDNSTYLSILEQKPSTLSAATSSLRCFPRGVSSAHLQNVVDNCKRTKTLGVIIVEDSEHETLEPVLKEFNLISSKLFSEEKVVRTHARVHDVIVFV